MSEPITVDLGAVTAYADAVEQGYTGTREEFGELLANFAKRAEEVKQDKEEVKQAKEAVFLKAESFDKHVEEEKTRVTEEFNSNAEQVLQTNKQEIENAKSEALENIANLKEDAVTQVNKTKTDGVQEIITLTNEKKSLLENTGTNQKNLVESEGTKQIQAVENKGAKTLQTIPEDYTALNNTVNILSDLMNTKAPAIVEEAKSGTEITVNDSAEMPLQGLNVYGKSKQVTTTGKNLCSIKSCQLSTKLVTSDIVPWTKSSRIYYAFDTQNISGAQAYISIKYHDADKKIVGSNGNATDCDGTRKTGSFNGKYANNGSDIDLTTIEYISVQLGLYRDSVTPSLIDNIMVSDDKNAPFEPYTGGKPSPSPEYPQEIVSVGEKGSIGVEITGKNLFDLSKEYTSDTVVNTFTFTLKPSTKYTLSTDFPATVNVASIYFGGSSSNINGVWKDRPKTFATDSSGNITVKIRTLEQDNAPAIFNDVLNGVYHIQLEEGNTATSYEPYKTPSTTTILLSNGLPGIPVTKGGNYTDENGQQYICDEIDFNRGKYIQRVWKSVFDGSDDEKWTYDDKQRARMILNNGNLGTYYKRDIASMCSNLLWNSNVYLDYNRENGYLINNNTFFVRATESLAINTEPDFRAWLASNPVTLQYVLATPIKTDLTEAQIQAYKSLTTFKPTSIISNDANAWMGASYVADTKLYIDSKIQEVASAIIASASEAE